MNLPFINKNLKLFLGLDFQYLKSNSSIDYVFFDIGSRVTERKTEWKVSILFLRFGFLISSEP